MSDPFGEFISAHPKGTIVSGTISDLDSKAVVVNLADGVEGVIKASDLSDERVDDARSVVKVGATVEAAIINVDRKHRRVQLSVRAKSQKEEAAAVEEYQQDSGGFGARLGDFMKQKFGG